MSLIVPTLQIIFFILASTAVFYYLIAIVAAERFFRLPRPKRSETSSPVSVLIPLCGTDPDAYENYVSFCRQEHPCFQLIFGVHDPDDPAIRVVHQICRDYPEVNIDLVIDSSSIGHNLKVGNLHNMLQKARHEKIIMVDSDIRVGSDYLTQILSDLQGDEVGLVTCLYRAKRAPNLASILEAIGITAEFQAGVLTARMLEGIKFGLGSTLATTKSMLSAVGGFPAIADFLGDDFMLGYLMAGQGREVRLSHCIVETSSEPDSLWSMILHQVRWSRGIRACRPWSYLGLIFTHGTVAALFFAIISGFNRTALILLIIVLFVRLIAGWRIGAHWMQDRILQHYFWLVPVRDLLSFVIWLMSLGGRKVEWRGILFKLVKNGQIVEIGRFDQN
jgi:ceramide glucosyltransferase